jgi:hypothetical protein
LSINISQTIEKLKKGKMRFGVWWKMQIDIHKRIAICFLLALAIAGTSQSAEQHPIINVMADMTLPKSATTDQLNEAMTDIFSITGATMYVQGDSERKSLNWTLFLVNEASLGNRLLLAQLGLEPSIEFAISGNQSDEKLSMKSYDEQKAILERAKEIVTATKVCGVNVITVKGFMPQSFDQNEDTYKLLDEMGIEYNAGFQAGILYAPGHENDVWPYKVEGHDFYAVPVSTITLSGEKVPLDDRLMKERGISASQWYDLLVKKLNEVSGKDMPMVISLSSSVSGKGDYFDAYKNFIQYALSKEARFVNTIDLVSMSHSGSHEAPALIIPVESLEGAENTSDSTKEKTSVCKECNAAKNTTYSNGTINVAL